MDSRRRSAMSKARELQPSDAGQALLTPSSLHCGSEQLYVASDTTCPNKEQFPEIKTDLYTMLAPIVTSVAEGAAEQLSTMPTNKLREPFDDLTYALNESFDSLYLSFGTGKPEAAACPHFQDLEYIIRPGIHTAIAAIDLIMTALDLDEVAYDYAKAGRLVQRIALLHADSLSESLAKMRTMLGTDMPVIQYDNSRMEFSDDFSAFLDEQEKLSEDRTRLGCPVMFNASSLRGLWNAYGKRYTDHYGITAPVA